MFDEIHYTKHKWSIDVDVLIDDSPAKLKNFKERSISYGVPICMNQTWNESVRDNYMNIDRLFGECTAQLLENMARQYPVSKGTYLDLVEFRMKLEDYYKKKRTLVLEQGYTQQECIANLYTDFGLKIKGTMDE